MESLRGQLLIAGPALLDPNFRRTVVLVVDDEPGEGTLGVVLNRPTEVPVRQVLEPWNSLASDPSVVFKGGVGFDTQKILASVKGRVGLN